MEDRFYLLKVRLLDIEPEIWRRFVVPADITLDRLHDVIQIVMGWQDYHLHDLMIGKQRYTEDPEYPEDGLEEGNYYLVDLIKRKGQKFSYTYDFGDNWEHELVLEDSRYSSPDLQAEIQCIEGERACPPEDVGSVPGYYEFCEAVKNPDNEEHESWNEWYDSFPWYESGFDSERFNLDWVNSELLKYMRWSRDRYKGWYRPE
jgi:hypothetical protein